MTNMCRQSHTATQNTIYHNINVNGKYFTVYVSHCNLITHHLSLVKHMSDSLLVLNKGKVVEYGKTAQVFAQPKSKVMKRLLNV